MKGPVSTDFLSNLFASNAGGIVDRPLPYPHRRVRSDAGYEFMRGEEVTIAELLQVEKLRRTRR